ncbi:hypothetical protein KTC96_24080 (plasmid) [Clostridium estertheticum]|uniref:hypothetical protein n=1 Tax=Clostridium estertheticum TaxID=238834 RepID=UPI001C7D8D43|nr:hypothetical protein [Clostridium estertheticum]MBX4262916.1 hypothetical protein [Clostridium estertheticum]WLC73204.1 hypothetical protein KTC96_24080 [Clostridium estertheticum]
MKYNTKSAKAGGILSGIAIVIALIAFVHAKIKAMPSRTEGIILFCTVGVFFSNIEIYKSQKNKANNSNNNI